MITIGEKEYTIGVLVQSNFGATEDFVLNGEAVGPKILEWKQEKSDMAASEEDKGSIMSILATDLPVTSRQLKRILKKNRCWYRTNRRLHRPWQRRGYDRIYDCKQNPIRL